jgi:DNA (cytosine-5)-methyltransferase 1
MIAIDFFCGAGGLTRGLLNAGIEVVLGIDNDERCSQTYETNNHPAAFFAADVRELTVEAVRRVIGDVAPDDLFLAACAPCQPFSQLNRGERNETATLLGQFGRFVEALRPRQVFVENVPGLTRVRGRSTHKRFRQRLEQLGYRIWEDVLDAKAYGVPQTRKRFVMIALRGFEPTRPPATHGPNLLPYEIVGNMIRHYPPLRAGETHPTLPNHRAAILAPINMERIRHTPHDGGGRTAWPPHLLLKCYANGYDGYTDVYGRMQWNSPAPALTGKCHSLSNGRYGHPEQDRAISLREAAKLQSFEDDYVFFADSLAKTAKQIGNAVPVKFAEAIGIHIRRLVGELDI